MFDVNATIGFPKRSLARLTASRFGAASDLTSGRSTILGASANSSEMRWSKSPLASLHRGNVFHDANARRKPAIDRHPVRRRLLAVNPERLKFSRGQLDFFFTCNLVTLLHFQFAGMAIEVPSGALFSGRMVRLQRLKLDQLAVEIDPSPAGNPVFVHREQISVGDRPRPVHFKLERSFPSTSSIPSRRYKTGTRILPSASGFTFETSRPFPISSVIL